MSAPPNILFILTDDQGYGDLSCHGNPILQTPAMDRLHDESVRLTDFHVGPTCAPTRATLLTGRYANSTGVWHTVGGRSLLREDEWTLADALRDAGYATGLFGKWHLGDNHPYRPMDRGFEQTITHGGGGITQTPDHWGNDYFDDVYRVNDVPTRFEGYCTDVWFQQTRAFIADSAANNRPWFAMLTPNAPHSPFNVAPPYAEPYAGRVPDRRARFYGMIANLDENLAALRDWLDEEGLAENTILIFMTDNGTACGASFDAGGYVTNGFNAGMRGMKGWPYEGGHRTPCFMHHPAGQLVGGRDIKTLTASVDMLPTLLDLCGVDVPEQHTIDGVSLATALRGEHQPGLDDRIVVTDSQRLPRPIKWRQSAAMSGPWRLINGEQLYNIDDDPEQRRDVASDHPDQVERLRAGYEAWWDGVSGRMDEPIPIAVRADEPTDLTAHDWHNENADCPWHQGMIRAGHRSAGYWELEVHEAGRYRVELRRWPIEADAAITAVPDPTPIDRDGVDPHDLSWYEGGTALPIASARLDVAGVSSEALVGEGERAATFEVDLPLGYCELAGSFADADTGDRRGAYYARLTSLASRP
ncbi:MAG: arylsulfatase [Planctomycetota bacterium]